MGWGRVERQSDSPPILFKPAFTVVKTDLFEFAFRFIGTIFWGIYPLIRMIVPMM